MLQALLSNSQLTQGKAGCPFMSAFNNFRRERRGKARRQEAMQEKKKSNISLVDLHPLRGEMALNSCANPDCLAFGQKFRPISKRLPKKGRRKSRCPTADQLEDFQMHRPGSYKTVGSKEKVPRLSTAFEYSNDPHKWKDHRTLQCQAKISRTAICETKFELLSEEHLVSEIDRLRSMNGVLAGPGCGHCGQKYLAAPDEFSMNGAHQRKLKRKQSAPKAIRVIHKPCKGKRGARFTISLPHARQKATKDNLRVLQALINSAGINDVKRILNAGGTKASIGTSRLYDRIAWLEQVFLAYEKEMLRRWKAKVENSHRRVVHRLSHDDLVLSVNWESVSSRSNTQLNCAITADATSGYVYRVDVDFDPTIAPMETFRECYLDDQGMPDQIAWTPDSLEGKRVPLFAWQRPTGRLHEPHFFAACENELRAFLYKAKRTLKKDEEQLLELKGRVDQEIEIVRLIGSNWFGFTVDPEESGGSFRGMTTRDLYTKAAHFALIRELLPKGRIELTTEQEGTLPRVLPHVFEKEVRQGQFIWMAMTFNRKAKKPDIIRKVKEYRTAWRKFHNEGMYDGRFDEHQDPAEITKAFIAERMQTATKQAGPKTRPYQIDNFSQGFMPSLWVHSPTQASGELDKTVGFPLVDPYLRHELKKVPFDTDVQSLDEEIREEIAELVYSATLQPASSFMNSVRERLGAAGRAGQGSRVAGSYLQGAMFNPRTLISLLNIFRVHYNFFEPRPYVTIDNKHLETVSTRRSRRSLKSPGTDEEISLPPLNKSRSLKATPAMRHGMDAFSRDRNGRKRIPNLYRVMYRPWLYAGTPVGKKFDRTPQVAKPEVVAASSRDACDKVKDTDPFCHQPKQLLDENFS